MPASGPLTGIRVLDLSGPPGHFCGKLLADLGADVVKVEPPGGDAGRKLGPFADGEPSLEHSLFWWAYNTGKRSITLDIATPVGAALLRRLVATSDVFLETYPPGHLSSLGLGPEVLRAGRPSLIYCSLTPFGQNGPWRDLRTGDLVSLSLGGSVFTNGYDDVENIAPMRPDGHQSWHIGGMYAFIGILAAVFHRDRIGRGQFLDISIHEACNTCTEWAIPNWVYHRTNILRQTGRHAALRPTAPWQYPCGDGHYVNILGVLPRDNGTWRRLVAWMAEEGMAGDLTKAEYGDVHVLRGQTQTGRDVSFDSPEARYAVEQIARFLAGQPAEQIYRHAQAIGLPWAVVRSPEEALDDPHFGDRNFWVTLEHAASEFDASPLRVTYPGAPYVFSESPWRIAGIAPRLGQHNTAIYEGELQLGKNELDVLRQERVI